MKIAMIGQKGLPAHSGGVERHVEDLATRISAYGADVLCYARTSYSVDKSNPLTYRGVRLAYIPTVQSKHLETVVHVFLASIHALFEKNLSIIHYHGIGPALFCWIPRLLRPSVRVIATFHCQDYYHQKWGVLARLAFRIGEVMACTVAHETVAVSKTIAEHIEKTYGRIPAYIPNAVPLREKSLPDKIRSFGLRGDDYFLCVSRLVKHKGLHTVIAGYRSALARGVSLPTLVIVGGAAYTEEYERELKGLAKDLPSILFLGEQSGEVLSELYSNARLFIHASESEGLSYVLLEAMSYGCPLLVSNIPEHRELVGESSLFDVKSADDLSRRIVSFIQEPTLFLQAAKDNHKNVRDSYNVDRIIADALSLYKFQSA